MEHSPIYRSSTRRTVASPISWRGTATFACAAAALTVSGMVLGYHSLSPDTAADTQLPPTAGPGRVAAPVPVVSSPLAGGGHPDLVSALSSSLSARVQAVPGLAEHLAVGPLAPFLSARPAGPESISLASLDVLIAPAEEDVAAVEDVAMEDPVASPDGMEAPLAVAQQPVVAAFASVSFAALDVALAEPEPVAEEPVQLAAAPAFEAAPVAAAQPPPEAVQVAAPTQSSKPVRVPVAIAPPPEPAQPDADEQPATPPAAIQRRGDNQAKGHAAAQVRGNDHGDDEDQGNNGNQGNNKSSGKSTNHKGGGEKSGGDKEKD
jgi:hypothetical protein